ncbi:MAG TPA: NAD-dependent epimerase/dehydratase family protein [Bacteroidetes bacterium]|nr:NAD-dependent epimerase/dehydratase family protein [Bacteroidota bacterium]
MVTGAAGQIGSELTMRLRNIYGGANVVAVDLLTNPEPELRETGPYETLDITEGNHFAQIANRYDIDAIYHLAAILSAVGERKPDLAWDVNMHGLKNVLDIARDREMSLVMVPSSIAVFGPNTPKENTPQETVLRPNSMYGVTKVAGELLCDYYYHKWGLDVRGVRYPGLISYKTLPGGGTTDYAVAIYYSAVKGEPYTCFVREETILPMMYMPDALRALLELAHADGSKLRYHNAYNVAALSFNVRELADSIRRHVPDFTVEYEPDFHQAIADGCQRSIDDSAAREDGGWCPEYDLEAMTEDMILHLRERHAAGELL